MVHEGKLWDSRYLYNMLRRVPETPPIIKDLPLAEVMNVLKPVFSKAGCQFAWTDSVYYLTSIEHLNRFLQWFMRNRKKPYRVNKWDCENSAEQLRVEYQLWGTSAVGIYFRPSTPSQGNHALSIALTFDDGKVKIWTVDTSQPKKARTVWAWEPHRHWEWDMAQSYWVYF